MYLACPATISFLAICGAAIAHFVGQRIKKNVCCSENVKVMHDLEEKSRVIDELEDQLVKLMNVNARIISDKKE